MFSDNHFPGLKQKFLGFLLHDLLLKLFLIWRSELYVQVAAPISGLVETLSDSEGSEISNQESTDSSKTENFFLTGLLDQLKISFSYSGQVCCILRTTGMLMCIHMCLNMSSPLLLKRILARSKSVEDAPC